MKGWKQKRSVIRRYNLTSQIYDDRYRDEQEAKYKAALNGLNLSQSDAVLDVGCGTGLFFNKIHAMVGVVVGVDVSKQILFHAKERARCHGNVSVVLADADHLPFKKNVFSFAFAFTLLQNMPNPVETLKQLREVADRDALFVITGLKAVVSSTFFGELLELSGLQPVSFVNTEALRYFVVRCIQYRS